jgi:hypothetical protein
MKKIMLILMCLTLVMGCYTLGKRFPLYDVRTVEPRREVLPERLEKLERSVYTDIWTQC